MDVGKKKNRISVEHFGGGKGTHILHLKSIVNVSEMFFPPLNISPKILPKSVGKFFKAQPSPPCCYAIIKNHSFISFFILHFFTSVKTLPLLFVLIRSPNHRLPFCFHAQIIATTPSWILFIQYLLYWYYTFFFIGKELDEKNTVII